MLVKDALKKIHGIHLEATNKNDVETIGKCVSSYKELLNSAPGDIAIMFGLATAEMQTGYNGVAITYFDKILEKKEDLPEVWNNLGTAYKNENKDEKAKECWEKALSYGEHVDYYNNMITLFINTGMPEDGMKWAERGLQLEPEHPRINWNYSLLLLEQGRWEEGFQRYEYGIESMDRPNRNYQKGPDLPWWKGEPGKRVIVYGEQGMGDEIMFASAMPDAMDDAEIIFDCHPRMVDLFKRSFGIPCHGSRKGNDVTWAGQYDFDARLPIGSLFRLYRSDGNFPKRPYLIPDRKLVKKYRKRLEESGPGPYVGIAWQAGTKGTRSDYRSLKLGHMKDLLQAGGTFISLQYSAGAEGKTERFYDDSGIKVHHWKDVVEANTGDLDKEGKSIRTIGFNYDHTVALIQALDLCILPNTTAVHTCGALGQECWTLTPKEAAWRYQFEGEEMPMYRSVRQFRGDNLIEQVTEEYRKRLSGGSWSEPLTRAVG